LPVQWPPTPATGHLTSESGGADSGRAQPFLQACFGGVVWEAEKEHE